MAYDPSRGEIHLSANNDFDGRSTVGPVDPIEAARHEAFEAPAELNMTPHGQRTAEAIAEVDKLSKRAASLATEANAALILQPPQPAVPEAER
jgi:hypothetical protein